VVLNVPLIVESILEKGFSYGVHSGFYLLVPKKHLSDPYNLKILETYEVEGEVLDVKKVYGELVGDEVKVKELVGTLLKFILTPSIIGSYDYLYITEESWSILRDYGVLPGDFILKVKLIRIKIGEKVVDIYPKRDVIAR
jgi:hypothetical protein